MKGKETLTPATTWMNLANIMLNKRRLTPRANVLFHAEEANIALIHVEEE